MPTIVNLFVYGNYNFFVVTYVHSLMYSCMSSRVVVGGLYVLVRLFIRCTGE